MKVALLPILFLVALTACSSTEVSSGHANANAKLADEILAGIRKKEQANGRTDAMLQEVQQMQDGREVWVLQSLNGGIAYVVGLKTPIRVQGPYNYAT